MAKCAELQNELIEANIRMILPADYLADIGASEQCQTGKQLPLHVRCLRIFNDLATRLAAERRKGA